ncbi:uncharacterized protein LTHEOB_936 [Lasiodiplodia theobromae]|uniref:Uncharacterized protein n=1 Tax=Lasiodiplodia theobromae TaxID=45133 RepID=A0A5N5DQ02_9PEZI|nr:uncharacterized protein LTHEOB_936 [Lasiodiplodia theobromae]KAB2580038.1 hypothetical protein DBV05_g1548 [Lasiodiplodia theobromae]KAF4540994.1 hypothetical protein LTHEOB_936 [Lasiodiplodia theobromae]
MPPSGSNEGPPAFFVAFEDYTFNRSLSVPDNFKTLAAKRGWGVGSKLWHRQWKACFGRAYAADQDPFDFFKTFSGYRVDRATSVLENFKRLAIRRHWGAGSKLWRRQWRACFGTVYTNDDNPFNGDGDSFAGTADSSAAFKPDHTATLETEFKRMALHEGLKPSDDNYAERRTHFYQQEFTRFFGNDKLRNLQKLCRIIDVPVGDTITQCKKALQDLDVMINLVNLINHMRTLPPEQTLDNMAVLEVAAKEFAGPCKEVGLIRFESWEAFSRYTKRNPFPKRAAKANGFVNNLLREMQKLSSRCTA